MTTTYLIVPALTDQSGQCRIVCTKTQLGACQALVHYRRWPDDWVEAGTMNSRGRIVALDAPNHHAADMRADEPLMASPTFRFED